MVNNPLDMRYIYKRERLLEQRKAIAESANVPDLSMDHCSKECYKSKVEKFLRECTSYEDAVHVLESLYNDDNFELLEMATLKVVNDIIPMVESTELPGCISYVESSDIGDVNKCRIIEAAKIYKSADRIRKNHKNISKRFDLSDTNRLSNRDKCFRVCEMVDTYKTSKFIKFNIALEEVAYLGFINGNRMSDSVMVENVLDYFLLIEDNSQEDIDSYKKAIHSSKVISENSDSSIGYFMNESCSSNSLYWKDRINEWKLTPDKNIQTLVEIARDNYSDSTALNCIIKTINEFCKVNSIEFDTMSIFEEDTNGFIDANDASNIINLIKENNIGNTGELLDSLNIIKEVDMNNKVYDDGTTTPETFTSDEFDTFKMHNLISDSQSVGEFLDQLEKTSMKEAPVSIDRIFTCKNIKVDESNLLENVDANGYISMCLRSYSYNGDHDIVSNLLESSIKCINSSLYNTDSYAYYTLSENCFDICIRTKYKIELSEAQELLRGFSEHDKHLILDIHNKVQSLQEICESNLPEIVSMLSNDRDIAANIGVNEAAIVYDILNPFNDSTSNDGFLDEFVSICREEANPKFDKIRESCFSVKPEEFTFDDDNLARIDFCSRLFGIDEIKQLTAADAAMNLKGAVGNIKNAGKALVGKPINEPKKKKMSAAAEYEKVAGKDTTKLNIRSKVNTNNNDSGDEDDDRDIKTLNDMKLAWQGAKSKLKGASAKEQEISRDLDMEFNHLIHVIKTTYGTDKREEIITGEVNHSLSKIIKIGITLAGIGAFTGPVIPLIGAIAMFAKSKHTSNKEKKLILDEIDIELKILEREISRAESSGSTKKYRQLLTIEKNLQRRRQEIYYGLTKKGKKIPMPSTTGLRSRE